MHTDQIPFVDSGFDHRVSLDLEEEHRTVSDQFRGKGHHVIDMFGCEDRGACCDPAQDWYIASGSIAVCDRGMLVDDHDCSGLGGILFDHPRVHQRVELSMDARR